MKFRKRFLLGTATVVAVPLTSVLAISCGDTQTGTLKTLPSKRMYNGQMNTQYSANALSADFSHTYGGKLGHAEDSTIATFFKEAFSGQPVIEQVEVTDSTTGEKSTVQKVKTPTFSWRKLILADAIVLTVDGQEIVFDSDEAEITPGPDAGEYYENSSYARTSNNPRSINSQNFLTNAEKATKLSFRIKENVHWVTKDGQETKYIVRAKDWYISNLRTYFFGDAQYRFANGGSKELDATFKRLLPNSDSYLSEKGTFGNKYLFGLYNVSHDKMISESDSVTVKDGREYYSFNALDESQPIKVLAMFDFILTSYDATPAPSEYIAEVGANHSYNKSVRTQLTSADAAQVFSTLEQGVQANSVAAQIGAYWYASNDSNLLYSGPYYYQGYDSQSLKDVYKINTHYVDQEFVNDDASIKELTVQYVTSPLDPAIFFTQNWNNYKAGIASNFANYSAAPDNIKNEVKKDPAKYGVTFVKSENKDTLTARLVVNLSPTNHDDKHKVANFNDAFAKLVYNSSLEDISNHSAINNVVHTTVGMGGEFLTLMNQAINWNAVANGYAPVNKPVVWTVGLAQDVRINNTEATPEDLGQTLREVQEYVHRITSINSETGQPHSYTYKWINDNGAEEEITATYLSPRQAKSLFGSESDTYKSVIFAKVQENLKALLDRFYQAHPELNGQKVSFGIGTRFTNISDSQRATMDSVVSLWNSLDSRIEVKLVENRTADNWYNYWYGFAPYTLVGWGYDYEGIGSGFDGFSSKGLMNILTVAAYDEAYLGKLEVAYPQLAVAAKAWKAFATGANELSIDPSKWSQLTAHELANIGDLIGVYKWSDELVENSHLVKLPEGEQKLSLGDITSKFWINYQDSHSKNDLIELAREVNTILGTRLGQNIGTSTNPYIQVLQNPYYSVPYSTRNVTFEDYRVDLEKLNKE